jgi:hypothetical protein
VHHAGTPQTFEALVRARKRAEERQARQEAKVAKDEQRRQEDLKSYKHIMKVGGTQMHLLLKQDKG